MRTVPVINGLTDTEASLPADGRRHGSYEEHRGPIQGKSDRWSGDGNNMATSWIHAAVQFDFGLRIACPHGAKPPPRRAMGGKVEGTSPFGTTRKPFVRGAIAWSPTPGCRWATRIREPKRARRHNLLRGYQVDSI